MTAPAGQRGGWLSAENRRRKLAASQETTMDASKVAKRLWVGGKPPFDRDLPEFDVLVLCAQELQPQRLAFGRKVIRCPLPDSDLNPNQLRLAASASGAVALALADQKRVLVTCAQGRNRSAFVASLALSRVTRLQAPELIELMRTKRHPAALSNPHFQRYLTKLVRTS
jgi:protein-tyrosine phosphatase